MFLRHHNSQLYCMYVACIDVDMTNCCLYMLYSICIFGKIPNIPHPMNLSLLSFTQF